MKTNRNPTRESPERCQPYSLWVQVRPRSSRELIRGWNDEGFLEVLVTAPPVGGEANRACSLQLARALGVPPSRVVLQKGHGAKRKKFRIEGVGREEAQARLRQWLRAHVP
jgi:uncharacterized protein YggU (UPF0235/DUF167 family)